MLNITLTQWHRSAVLSLAEVMDEATTPNQPTLMLPTLSSWHAQENGTNHVSEGYGNATNDLSIIPSSYPGT